MPNDYEIKSTDETSTPSFQDRVIAYQENELVEAQKMLDLSISQLNSIQGQIQAYNERIKNIRRDLASYKGEN